MLESVDEGCALLPCEGCKRHVRCGEHVCPFCGAALRHCIPVSEFRIESRLPRGLSFRIGAALTTAGFAMTLGTCAQPAYGLAPGWRGAEAVPVGGTGGEAGAAGEASDGGQAGTGGDGGSG